MAPYGSCTLGARRVAIKGIKHLPSSRRRLLTSEASYEVDYIAEFETPDDAQDMVGLDSDNVESGVASDLRDDVSMRINHVETSLFSRPSIILKGNCVVSSRLSIVNTL